MAKKEKTLQEIEQWKAGLDEDRPCSFNLICEETEDFIYTTGYWSTVTLAGRNFQPETGIKAKINGQPSPDDFRLIQHGNWLYQKAHEKIVEMNERGASLEDIEAAVCCFPFEENPLRGSP